MSSIIFKMIENWTLLWATLSAALLKAFDFTCSNAYKHFWTSYFPA